MKKGEYSVSHLSTSSSTLKALKTDQMSAKNICSCYPNECKLKAVIHEENNSDNSTQNLFLNICANFSKNDFEHHLWCYIMYISINGLKKNSTNSL